MKDQLNRASLSVVLNLSEGSAKSSVKDRKRFYEIAFASHRETQTIFDLIENQELIQLSDQLAGGLYNLIRSLKTQT